jgi:WD40 repeat protein
VKEVHLLTFQHDGALVCSGDFAGVGNVWDLRCGKKIMSLTGHVKRIVSGDFAPNGFQVNQKSTYVFFFNTTILHACIVVNSSLPTQYIF